MQQVDDNIKIDMLRISQLEKGDLFLFHNLWREVSKIKDGILYYKIVSYSRGRGQEKMPANSKLFVQTHKSEKPK